MNSWRTLICLVQIPTLLALSIAALNSPVRAQTSRSECWQLVRESGGSQKTADAVCSIAPSYAGQCFQNVRFAGASIERAVSVCKNGTVYSGICFQDVRAAGASWDSSESLCTNATADTGQCVRNGVIRQESWTRILSGCRPVPLAEVLQACMDSIMFDAQGEPTGISEAAAIEQCRRARGIE